MRNKILPTFIGVVIINFCLAFLLFRYNGTDLGIKNTIILLSDDLCVQIPYIIVQQKQKHKMAVALKNEALKGLFE